MSSRSRRKVLRAGGVLCSVSLAGCVDWVRSAEQEARLTDITLQNHTSDEQSVLVIIEDGSEQVYDGFTAVPPADDESPVSRNVTDIPEEPGVYDIYFDLARRPEAVEGEFWARAENIDVDCREYLVEIRTDETGKPWLGIYRSNGC